MKNKWIIWVILAIFLLSSCTSPFSSTSSTNNPTNQTGSTAPFNSPTPTATPLPQTSLSNGEADFHNGDFDAALNEFNAAEASTDPEIVAKAMLLTGRIYLQRQDYQTAVQKLGNLVNLQPAGASRNQGFFFLAQSYEGLQQYQLAADAYQNYLSLTPNSPIQADILEMQGDDLVNAGNNSAALQAYQQALPTTQPEYVEELGIKVAETTAASGDAQTAITEYLTLYNTAKLDSTKATVNLMLGRLYLQNGQADEAYKRFQDSVAQYPMFYDTYSGLIALVNDNQPVDDRLRGIVDYYAAQYGLATSAFDRYLAVTPNPTADVYYYKALSYYNMGDYQNEVAQWDLLIQKFPNDPNYYADAFIEKATTQWQHLQQYQTAAQTLIDYVTQAPDASVAPAYLYQAARIYEQGNLLELAAQTWQKVTGQYPSYEKAILAQFNAGICYYRLGEYQQALLTFQRNALLASADSNKARAEMWIGKTQLVLNNKTDAQTILLQAAKDDPTGYYSIRAGELANGQAEFVPASSYDLGVDLNSERSAAADWMHSKFNIASDVDLLSPGDLANNILYQRGDAFWSLGLTIRAQTEFDSLRDSLSSDPVNSFRLMNHLLDLGVNQSAILCARQILDLLGLGNLPYISETPAYFNHVRFGPYYRDIIVSAANENGIDPLIIFSVVRQESLFEADITSSQGASGLMQIIPSVGQEINTDYGWPANYIDQDLTRPFINVKMGSHYLAKWYNYFDKDMIAALAAYNGGIGFTLNWNSLANGDPDLLLEIIPDSYETQDYIRQIVEYFEVYKTIYSR